MAPLAVQAAAFVALVLLLDTLLARRGWPQLRHALWLLAALRFVLPPSLSSPVGVGEWLGHWAAGTGSPATSMSAVAEVDGALAALDATPLFLIWLGGALGAAALALRGRRLARAALRGSSAPLWMQRVAVRCARSLRLRRAPRLVLVAGLPSACVRGLLRPVVALPAGVARGDVETLLVHELAHVKRGDLWVDAALTWLRVAFWFHPGAWLVKARVGQVRELCCDATAAAALGPRAGEYRATLLRAAARLLGEGDGGRAPQPAFAGASSQIVARLRWLERRPSRRPVLRSATVALATITLATCALPMARHVAPSSRPSDAVVRSARELIASALDGSARPGCIRLHFAALTLAADDTLSDPAPLP